MRSDFCAFILTHGRPDNVRTLRTLRKVGYTGPIYLVIDDEDRTGDEYRKRYGDKVVTFSKSEMALTTDAFDNTQERRTPLWARNACWAIAERLGFRYFVQLDDDYTSFWYRRAGRFEGDVASDWHKWHVRHRLDDLMEAMVRLLERTPAVSVAFSQGGDHVGGKGVHFSFGKLRKAMNSFFCDTQRPFQFRGKFNDDVNTYVGLGSTGAIFMTTMSIMLDQRVTQEQSGGITEAYLAAGTYVKSFFTVMMAPSCVNVEAMRGCRHKRYHHHINWTCAVPKIIAERWKRAA